MLNQEKIPQEVLEVCNILIESGNQAFLVGGSIRDLLIGLTPNDWDITTDAKPDTVMEVFRSQFKVIPTGIKHGTVTVINNRVTIEITTFRVEGEYKDGRRPSKVSFVSNIEADLARRDLTINSIAYDPIRLKMIDPYGGLDDIKTKLIRMVGNPDSRLDEDGLRAIRIFRFASQLGYKIDKKTLDAVPRHFSTFARVARERIYVELIKMLEGKYWKEALRLLAETSLLKEIFPKFKYEEMTSILDKVNMSRFEITLNVIKNLVDDATLSLKVAVLIHQLSAIDRKTRRIFPLYNGRIITDVLKELKFPNKMIFSITQILRNHTLPLPYDMSISEDEKNYKTRKFQYEVGPEFIKDYFDFYNAKKCIMHFDENRVDQFIEDFMYRAQKHKPIYLRDLAINGDFIIKFFNINKRFSSQREFIGLCLDTLRERVEFEPDLNTKSKLIKILNNISRVYNQCLDEGSNVRIVATDHIRKLYTANEPCYSAWENSHTYRLCTWLVNCLLKRRPTQYVIFDGTNFNFPTHSNHLKRIFTLFRYYNPIFIRVKATEEEVLLNLEERKKESKSTRQSDAGLDVYMKYKELIEKYPYALTPPEGSLSFDISTRSKDFESNLQKIVMNIKNNDCRLIVLSGNVLSGKSFFAKTLRDKLLK